MSTTHEIEVEGQKFTVEQTDDHYGYPRCRAFGVIELPGLKAELMYDEDPLNPFKDYEPFAQLVTFGTIAREYDFGGERVYNPDMVGDRESLVKDCPRCDGNGEDPERYELVKEYAVVGVGSGEAMYAEYNRLLDKYGEENVRDMNPWMDVRPADCHQC